jgi:serine/threonine protein kinase
VGREGVEALEEDAAALARQDTRREVSFDGRDAPANSVSHQRLLPRGSRLGRGRFEVLRPIGEGGMGAVYEVYDAELASSLALKTLSHADRRGIQQFEKEFRALSGIQHPGLVRLHELFVEGDLRFFTMDLIDGERFDLWARPGGELDERRLRRGLRQLVHALGAIHQGNKLHRDVKSSNVLVSADERVVVLDLGLVTEIGKSGAGQTISEWVLAGTPEYMPPEQAFGFPATSASDFYGMGVMLFEALTGRLPFAGQLGEILAAKQREPELWPMLRGANAPKDLAELCLALLSRDPAHRPSAAEMLEGPCLVDEAPSPTLPPETPTPRPFSALLGRAAELSLLWAAHRDARNGQAVLVEVSGESGVGKTELCRSFLEQVRAEQLATVLGGRCHERDGGPFQALAPLARELARHLGKLEHDEAAQLIPEDVFALARSFPVIARVAVVAEAPERVVADPYELARLGFAAFANLLGRMHDRRPLVVHIDDAHWLDGDSVAFLRHALVDRGLGSVLIILSRRSPPVSPEGGLEQVLGAARSNPRLSVRRLPVEPLPTAEAEALALELLCRSFSPGAALARSIAVESRGSPLLVTELVRLAAQSPAVVESASGLDAITLRVQRLSDNQRRLLQTVALMGQPLSSSVALDATSASPADLDALLELQLLRDGDAEGQDFIECHHDRIRAAVVAGLTPDAKRVLWRELATALARDPSADPEPLSRAWEEAGERLDAARLAVIAAERANRALAFGHAAALYRRALELGAGSDASGAELATELGVALENAGRGAEAAAVYRQVAEASAGEEALEPLRRAAEQLLAAGHVEEGSELLASVCGALDVYHPESSASARLSLAWTGLRLRLCDLNAAPVRRELSRRDALRLRTAYTAATGLVGYLPTHAASSAGRYLLLALDADDVRERVCSLGVNVYMQTLLDPASPRSGELLQHMDELAESSESLELTGFVHLIKGISAFYFDRCRDARRCFERALLDLRGAAGVSWQLDVASIHDQLSASYCGDYADIARSTPTLVDEALRRGRVWTAAMLSGFGGMAAWMTEGPGAYRRQLAEVTRYWQPRSEPLWPDYLLLMGEALLCVYEGQPERGVILLDERRAAYRRYMRGRGAGKGGVGYDQLQGRCAAAALGTRTGSPEDRASWAGTLRRALVSLEKHGGPKARGMATLYQGVLARERGDAERSSELLRGALGCFERAGMEMFAAAAQRRLGQLVGGAEGRELREQAEAFMYAEGLDDLEIETEVHCPGYGPR